MVSRARVALGALMSGAVLASGCSGDRDEAYVERPDPTTTTTAAPGGARGRETNPPRERFGAIETPTEFAVEVPSPLRRVSFGLSHAPSATDQGLGVRVRTTTGESFEVWAMSNSANQNGLAVGAATPAGARGRVPDDEPAVSNVLVCGATRAPDEAIDPQRALEVCEFDAVPESLSWAIEGADLHLVVGGRMPADGQSILRWRTTGPITAVTFLGLGRTSLVRNAPNGVGCTSATEGPGFETIEMETIDSKLVPIPEGGATGRTFDVVAGDPGNRHDPEYIIECESPDLVSDGSSVRLQWRTPPTRELQGWLYEPINTETPDGATIESADITIETNDPFLDTLDRDVFQRAVEGDARSLATVQRAASTWGAITTGRDAAPVGPWPSGASSQRRASNVWPFDRATGPVEVCQLRPGHTPELLCVPPAASVTTTTIGRAGI